ncbi:MAG: nuclear transport factor 2 family protein [Acidobacteriota bacterium]
MSLDTDARTARVVHFYEHLTPGSLAQIQTVYAEQAHFKDPFNDVQGLGAITRVFQHMFDTLDAPRFVVLDTMTQGDQAWLSWNFIIRRAQGDWTIHGATHLHFAEDGRIKRHRDYWDPAQELYARLPILGPGVRWLTRRLSASA